MTRNAILSLLASGFLMTSAACKSETTPPVEAPQTTGAATTAGMGGVGDTFGTLRAIHSAEVEHGTMAMNKATDPRVKAFAERVVDDHKARMRKDDSILSAMGISARDNPVSQQIKAASDQQTARLDALTGKDFDRAYIEEQVNYYRAALDTFDRDLLPNVRDPGIRANVAEARAKANEHLKEAQDLRVSLIGQ